MLSHQEKQCIIKRFPKCKELSYDAILHKKVYADLFMVKPKGVMAYIWFTYIRDKNVCILIEVNKKGEIKDLNTYPACFDNALSLSSGTIIVGTHFVHNDQNYFATEDVLVYQGTNVASNSFNENIILLREIFERHICQKSYNSNFMTFGMPCWCRTYNAALQTIDSLPYNVYGIKAINTKNTRQPICGIYRRRERKNVEGIFEVKADVESDIYNLYCFDPRNSNVYGRAAVPTYKRSVELNNIFRRVKENTDLDKLEESDDEDDFENIEEDKFVDTKKSVIMRCIYHKKFGKWEPIEVMSKKPKPKLITRELALRLEKNV